MLLSARRVGATGKAYGLDMTDEMLELARRNAAEAKVPNVEFLKGQIETVPLSDGSVDVVISNCVINLSTDKPAVFAETFRVLKPGGRLGVSDVVAEDHLTAAQRAERGGWVGCVAGALSMSEYRAGLQAAGFTDVQITPTHGSRTACTRRSSRRPSPPDLGAARRTGNTAVPRAARSGVLAAWPRHGGTFSPDPAASPA